MLHQPTPQTTQQSTATSSTTPIHKKDTHQNTQKRNNPALALKQVLTS